MSWTEERVEKLKEFWAEGMSASQIAKQLGGVTRNAVIGKVHRLGLSHRSPTEGGAAEGAETETVAEGAPREPAKRTRAPEADGVAAAPPADGAESAEPAASPAEPPAVHTKPEAPERETRDLSQPRPPGPPTPEEEEARISLAEIEKLARRLDLLELTERTCKWPIGDPAEDGFHFCGLPAVMGKPYCEHHIAIAFQPVSSRRDRSRSR